MSEPLEKTIYFLTGASGVGKTTLVSQLKAKYKDKAWTFLHFDEIGIPSEEQMIKDFGSGAGWQEAKTYEWIEKLIHTNTDRIFFEGQVNLQFIRNGFSRHGFTNYKIILIDCNEAVMRNRLVNDRNQSELFTPEMLNWLKFLRHQANEFNATVIDSSDLSKEELRQKFEEKISLQ